MKPHPSIPMRTTFLGSGPTFLMVIVQVPSVRNARKRRRKSGHSGNEIGQSRKPERTKARKTQAVVQVRPSSSVLPFGLSLLRVFVIRFLSRQQRSKILPGPADRLFHVPAFEFPRFGPIRQ